MKLYVLTLKSLVVGVYTDLTIVEEAKKDILDKAGVPLGSERYNISLLFFVKEFDFNVSTDDVLSLIEDIRKGW